MAVSTWALTAHAAASGRVSLAARMKVIISEQLLRFVSCIGFGVAAALLYRIRAWFTRGRVRFVLDALLDLGYWIVVIPGFIAMILTVCQGELRLYHLCGIGCGVVLTACFHRTEAYK